MADNKEGIYGLVSSIVNFGSNLTAGILQNRGIRDSGATDLAALQLQGQNQQDYFAGLMGLSGLAAEGSADAAKTQTKMIVSIVVVIGLVVIAGMVIYFVVRSKK